MRVHVYKRRMSGGGISEHVQAAFEGFKRHGLQPRMLEVGRPEPCDLAVCWGVRKAGEIASGRRAMILERGYVGDRYGKWTSVGFDGLNGRADFRNAGKDSTRWDANLAEHMEAWFEPGTGEYVLVMGQVPGDAALGSTNIDRWAVQIMRQLQSRRIPARFRPHPLAGSKSSALASLPHSTGDLAAALERAMWVVTFNSNSGVDAVLQGVPAVAMDPGAMAWPVTGRVPWEAPPMPDRTRWAAELAWCQWTLEEIRRGDAWDHLRDGLAV